MEREEIIEVQDWDSVFESAETGLVAPANNNVAVAVQYDWPE
ncbi:hypothetical protein AB0H69_22995 [Streptomyces phaeochromogenes]